MTNRQLFRISALKSDEATMRDLASQVEANIVQEKLPYTRRDV